MATIETLPAIEDAHLDAMRSVAKPVPDHDWRKTLCTTISDGTYLRGRYDLPQPIDFGPHRGTLYLFLRLVRVNLDDFSVGLAFTDLAGNGPYRLVRCNGFHPERHRNHMENPADIILPETPHIHWATYRYTNAKRQKHDGYAEKTELYSDLSGAIEVMAAMAHLTADGRLVL